MRLCILCSRHAHWYHVMCCLGVHSQPLQHVFFCLWISCLLNFVRTHHPSPRLPLRPVHPAGVSGGVLGLHPAEYQVPWNKCKGTVQVQSRLQCSQHCQPPVPPAHRGPGGPNWSGLQCDHHTHLDWCQCRELQHLSDGCEREWNVSRNGSNICCPRCVCQHSSLL